MKQVGKERERKNQVNLYHFIRFIVIYVANIFCLVVNVIQFYNQKKNHVIKQNRPDKKPNKNDCKLYD